MNENPDGLQGQQHDASPLAERLMAIGYLGLFQSADEQALDALWGEPGMPEALAVLTADAQAPILARFLAAEILLYKLPAWPAALRKEDLASIYAAALAQNLAGPANTWGLPKGSSGLAGEHIVALGEAVVPALVGLLDTDTRVHYEGSREATAGQSYRVKDLAAYFISQIRGLPLDFDEDPARRDEAIEQLKRTVQ